MKRGGAGVGRVGVAGLVLGEGVFWYIGEGCGVGVAGLVLVPMMRVSCDEAR